jgi:ribonuclease P protein component
VRGQQIHTAKLKFDPIYARGRSWAGKEVVIRALLNNLEASRFGFVASRRVGNAVVRNRVRRRLKEIIRSISIKPGWDIIIIARVPAAEADFQNLSDTVVKLLAKAGLVTGENENISHGAN